MRKGIAPNKTLESDLERIAKEGWEFSLRWDRDRAKITLWREDWPTDNLYAARVCPTFDGDSLREAVDHVLSQLRPSSETSDPMSKESAHRDVKPTSEDSMKSLGKWGGRPVESLSKDELIEALARCGREINRLHGQNASDIAQIMGLMG